MEYIVIKIIVIQLKITVLILFKTASIRYNINEFSYSCGVCLFKTIIPYHTTLDNPIAYYYIIKTHLLSLKSMD